VRLQDTVMVIGYPGSASWLAFILRLLPKFAVSLPEAQMAKLMRPQRFKRCPTMLKASAGESEYLTRKQIVDSKLRAAGWRVVAFKPNWPLSTYDNCAIEEFPTESGPTDYALCVGGQILGVVEARKLTLGPQEALTQAERQARRRPMQ